MKYFSACRHSQVICWIPVCSLGSSLSDPVAIAPTQGSLALNLLDSVAVSVLGAQLQTFSSPSHSRYFSSSVSSFKPTFPSILQKTKSFADSSPSAERKLSLPEPNWFPSQRRQPRGLELQAEPSGHPSSLPSFSWVWTVVLEPRRASGWWNFSSRVLAELMSESEGEIHLHCTHKLGFPPGASSLPGCSRVWRSWPGGRWNTGKGNQMIIPSHLAICSTISLFLFGEGLKTGRTQAGAWKISWKI